MNAPAGWPVRHPVAALLILIVLALTAAVLSPRLPLERLPSPAGTTLQVQARLPGLVPQQVEYLLAQPLEDALHPVAGLRDLIVRSSDGWASIELGFDSAAAREQALGEVRTRIAEVASQLPAGTELPLAERSDPPLQPAAVYAIVAERLSGEVSKWAERQLRRPLHELQETTAAELEGVDALEILVQPDPRRLVALGLSFDDVIQALRGSDQAPRGQRTRRVATALPTSAEAIAVRALRLPGGEPIALAEAAEVSVVQRAATQRPVYEGKPALLLRVYPRSSAEAANVADRVAAHLAWLQANGLVPAEVTVHKVFDESDETSRWLRRVLRRVGAAVVITLAAVYLFFGLRTGVTMLGAFAVWLPACASVLWASGMALNVMAVAGIMFGYVALALVTLRASIAPALAVLSLATVAGAWIAGASLGRWAPAIAALGLVALASVPVGWLLSARTGNGEVTVAPALRWLPPRWRTHAVLLPALGALLLLVLGFGVRTLPAAVADVTGGTVRLYVRGEDEEQLSLLSSEVLARLRAIASISDISHSMEPLARWQLRLDLDKLQEAEIGITTVARYFELARAGLVVGELIDADANLALRVQLAPGTTGAAFERLPLRGERKDQPALYLRDVGVAERMTAARERVRVQRQPAVEIRAHWRGPAVPIQIGRLAQTLAFPPGYTLQLEALPRTGETRLAGSAAP